MKPIKSRTAVADATIAFSKMAAGVRLCKALKMDAISKSKTKISAILAALLIGSHSSDLLKPGDSNAKSAAVSLGREAPDLIDFRKVLGAGGEEEIATQAMLGLAGYR